MSHYRHEEESLGYDIPEEQLEDEVGCYYPGRCCMPGYHLRGECAEAPVEYRDPQEAA
ncbi:MAG: hypothetical protein Q8P41_31810 [Pseudomonadota bacterium]|nr:hypothetical protein [Pseudomonadota bacterium]